MIYLLLFLLDSCGQSKLLANASEQFVTYKMPSDVDEVNCVWTITMDNTLSNYSLYMESVSLNLTSYSNCEDVWLAFYSGNIKDTKWYCTQHRAIILRNNTVQVWFHALSRQRTQGLTLKFNASESI